MPLLALHCQPPLLAARSPSTRRSMKARSPQRQSMIRSLTRKEATIMRQRLCIQPLALS